ncbi:MAG: type IV pilus modification PilV family protein [Chthonomonadales bacterium]
MNDQPRQRLALRRSAGGRHREGFTLVEMIVAALLLVLGGVAALTCISAATRSMAAAQTITTAALLAQQKISEMEADPTQLMSGDQQGDFSPDHPDYTWQTTVEPTDLAAVEKVTLTVQHRSTRGGRSVQIVTYEPVPQNTGSGNAIPTQ